MASLDRLLKRKRSPRLGCASPTTRPSIYLDQEHGDYHRTVIEETDTESDDDPGDIYHEDEIAKSRGGSTDAERTNCDKSSDKHSGEEGQNESQDPSWTNRPRARTGSNHSEPEEEQEAFTRQSPPLTIRSRTTNTGKAPSVARGSSDPPNGGPRTEPAAPFAAAPETPTRHAHPQLYADTPSSDSSSPEGRQLSRQLGAFEGEEEVRQLRRPSSGARFRSLLSTEEVEQLSRGLKEAGKIIKLVGGENKALVDELNAIRKENLYLQECNQRDADKLLAEKKAKETCLKEKEELERHAIVIMKELEKIRVKWDKVKEERRKNKEDQRKNKEEWDKAREERRKNAEDQRKVEEAVERMLSMVASFRHEKM
ncbi:uncharacterized protein DSM5745_00726 [Aspergillus mulundensis]|uniref:Uncharacterized protein n=1 Tax=Aspergillus mulundensis TaxID=1810919 RepID=A0A3D8T4D0_9EURO|nr:hypothetical protein DSM5745_00726 [Aspergillus mulundensis]RDW93404.1 hypothetical protein DSM5745_00726 [Aspergillus mulundensis]